MSKVFQEFYCNDCFGYILVTLNIDLNHTVKVVCPQCGRQHPRTIRDGRIYDEGSGGGPVEEICPTKSAYSKEPRTKKMTNSSSRNGEVIKSASDISERDPAAQALFNERWFEMFGGK